MSGKLTSKIAVFMATALVAFSTGRTQAALAPAVLGSQTAVRAQDIQTVQTFLERKEVGQHLAGFHMTAPEIESRLNNLSDDELHQVAVKIHQQQPGRDGGGAIVTVLVIGILVLLFVYLLKRV